MHCAHVTPESAVDTKQAIYPAPSVESNLVGGFGIGIHGDAIASTTTTSLERKEAGLTGKMAKQKEEG